MKKKLKLREYGLIGAILIVIVGGGWQIMVTSTKVTKTPDEHKSFEVKEVEQSRKVEAQTHKQHIKLRRIVHTAERIQENSEMPYHLQQVKDVDPHRIDVVRWPKDQNDQWRDSEGKAFPIDSIDRFSRKATIRDNPSKDLKYVVKFAGRGAFIGYLNGEKGMEIPLSKKINGQVYQIQDWIWLDGRTLVGVMNHDLDLNDHVEYGDTRIYLYKINDDLKSGQLVEVSTPFIPHRSTIKIEGITSSGALALSRVYDGAANGIKFNYSPKNYSSSGYEPEKFLGVFEVKEQSP